MSKIPISPLCCAATIALLAKLLPEEKDEDNHLKELKLRAARAASRAMSYIAEMRQILNLPFSPDDLGKTGLIGINSSVITTNLGALKQKRASLNPNYAALIVQWLFQLKMKPGDRLALSITGSCPALNICVYSALSTMELNPIIISSVGSSHYGANDPAFCWLDMEQSLLKAHLIPFKSHLVSIGGNGDCGKNLSEEGVRWIVAKIQSMSFPFLQCSATSESILRRMDFYESMAADQPIKVYINVGGAVASVSRREKKLLVPGLNVKPVNAEKNLPDSVMQRFCQKETPAIHLNKVMALAEQYHLSKVEDGVVALVSAENIFKSRKNYKKGTSAVALFCASCIYLSVAKKQQRILE